MSDEQRIERALNKVAVWVVEDPAFLPVFERLECELEAVQSKKAALERARMRAAKVKGQ